jgi:hypothetical protein
VASSFISKSARRELSVTAATLYLRTFSMATESAHFVVRLGVAQQAPQTVLFSEAIASQQQCGFQSWL